MIYYLLLAVSIMLTVCKSSFYNTYAKKSAPTLFSTFAFNGVAYGCAALFAIIPMIFGGSLKLTAPTVICALFYAIIVFSLQSISIFAMRVGAMAETAICVMYGMIIPSLAGPIFWDEPFGLLRGLGIGLMLISLWLIQNKSSGGSLKSKKWLILAAFAFILSGMAGLMEKIHQSTSGASEKNMFVFTACLAMFIISLISVLAVKKRASAPTDKRLLITVAAPVGIVIGMYSIVNLTLAGALDSMIYYPVANGGAMLLTVIASLVIFREGFDIKKLVGTVIGLGGIVCLSIPV